MDRGGTNAGITKVEFKIKNSTSWDGFAENATSAEVTGLNKTLDYSFDRLTDVTTYTATIADPNNANDNGEIRAEYAFAAFWCKDYGGYCEVEVTVWKEENDSLTQTLQIPLDKDQDKIGDQWEWQQRTEWGNQYGEPAVWDPLSFTRREDDERRDPDGDAGPLFPQAKPRDPNLVGGDHIPVSAEYRGFILDGGKSIRFDGIWVDHTGGHRRLSAVRKEGLWEVDREAILGPTTAADLDTMLRDAAFIWAKAGNSIYYVLQDTNLTPPKTTWTGNLNGDLTSYLKTTRGVPNGNTVENDAVHKYFSHFLVFADDGGSGYGGTAAGGTLTLDETPRPIPQETADRMGSYIWMNNVRGRAAAFGVQPTSLGAFAFAHEYMHVVIDVRGAWPITRFDANEHFDPAWDPGMDDLMGQIDSKTRLLPVNVRIGPVTQKAINFRENPMLWAW